LIVAVFDTNDLASGVRYVETKKVEEILSMRRHLHATGLLVLALILALAIAAPVGAQDREVQDVTFELTLYGDVPEGDGLLVTLAYVQGGGSGLGQRLFCGFEGTPVCQGNGTVYRQTVSLIKSFVYRFGRVFGNDGNFFTKGTEEPEKGKVIRAWYSYADDEQDDDEQIPDEMPDTGAGGMAGGPPVGSAAAALFLLTAGGYAVRRRL